MAQSEFGSGFGRTHPDHTAARPSGQTAKMRENAFCETCGWPVIFAFCNDGMGQMAPYSDWDNWIYCANKTCLHHGGEGIYHNVPEWIKTTG